MDDLKTRGTLTFTHRQLGISAIGIGTFLTIMNFLNGNYASRSDVRELKAQNLEIKAIVKDGFAHQEANLFSHSTEETHKHERMMDTVREELKAEKDDRIRDVSFIENLLGHKTKKN